MPADETARHPGHRPTDPEADLYLPPRRLWRYQINKIIGAAVVAMIFTGWLILQWESLWMRLLASCLLGMTAYVTIQSIVTDLRRACGRQIALHPDRLVITEPSGQTTVRLDDIAELHWRDDTSANLGLWLVDDTGQPLAHLDEAFLEDPREARAFLGWLRRITNRRWMTRWPG